MVIFIILIKREYNIKLKTCLFCGNNTEVSTDYYIRTTQVIMLE